MRNWEFDTEIRKVEGIDAAYIVFPYDLRRETGMGRLKVDVSFDGYPYCGSVVNMGVKNTDGSICYIIGIRKDIRKAIGKGAGATVHVAVRERTEAF